MSYEMLNNNKVYLQGEVADVPKYNHTVLDENFYSFNLIVPRLSGQNDILPITISSKLIDENQLKVGDKIALRGQFRSYNKLEEGKSNRNYDKSDYIPCIAWGRNAQFVNKLQVGTKLEIEGRIQSREYNKHYEGADLPVTKTAYEVSIIKLATAEDKTAL